MPGRGKDWIARPGRAAAAALLALGGCATSDSVTSPRLTDAPCAGGAALQLAPLGVANLDCTDATTVTLAGGGAAYLVAAALAAGDVTPDPVSYTISVPSTAVYSRVPASGPGLAAGAAPRAAAWSGAAAGGSPLARAFDAALRARGAALAARMTRAPGVVPVAPAREPPTGAAAAAGAGADAAAARPAASDPPALGSLRSFQVLANTDFNHERYAPVSARLVYAGTNVLVYLDRAAPAGGFSDAELERFGRYYDEVLFPLDAGTFGPPSDIDGNGRLIMLLTPVVNGLVSAAQCATRGYVGGFFNPVDLSGGGSSSNRGEIFYAIVPDPAASVSCAHDVAGTEALLGGTFLHEVQHLISYAQHVLAHHGKAQSGWLDEGLSLVAEELGALYYEARYPAPLGRSDPAQLLPDSALPFLANNVAASYEYLQRTDTTTLTTHGDADGGAGWRGGDWLLVRWLGSQKGGVTFYRAVEQASQTGVAGIETAAGEPFSTLFGDFGLALYSDSLPGVARAAVPARDAFGGRTLRQLLSAAGATVFPLEPAPLTGAATATLVPGGVALYRIHTTSSAGALTLRFATPAGAALPPALHPRLAIMRLP